MMTLGRTPFTARTRHQQERPTPITDTEVIMAASASRDINIQPEQDTQDAQDDLEKLAAELNTHSYKTVLVARDGRLPYLDVLNPDAPALSERIYAQADFFWWPWAQAIARRDQITPAANAIARVLRINAPATGE